MRVASAGNRQATDGVLVMVVVLGSCAPAWGVSFAGGDGTPKTPYQIATAEQLIAIGCDPNLWDKHFALVQDLDLKGIDPNAMTPIGNCDGEPFLGAFDGKGHTVSNLRIMRGDEPWIGFFGQIGDRFAASPDPNLGHIRNLHLRDIVVQGGNVVGGLAGELGSGRIHNCSVTGVTKGCDCVGGLVGWAEGEVTACTVGVEVQGNMNVGGLIGDITGNVMRCASSGHVAGRDRVGGLIGAIGSSMFLGGIWEGSIDTGKLAKTTQCRSDCSVVGTEDVGGLIACAVGVGTIEDCYALGQVDGSARVGGLVGTTVGCCVVRCFSTASVNGNEDAGGLVGKNEPCEDAGELARYPPCQFVVEEVQEPSARRKSRVIFRPAILSCFWDGEASGMTRGLGAGADAQGGIVRLTTSEMRTMTPFRDFGWDFEEVWAIEEGKPYPRLRWELVHEK
jgi:hypothetical protein